MHRIAITPGEPAGIGLDLVIELVSNYLVAGESSGEYEAVIIADQGALKARAKLLGKPFSIPAYSADTPRDGWSILHIDGGVKAVPGAPDSSTASYVLATLERAVSGCQVGEFQAMTTGPVQKSVLNRPGFDFNGHTEFLAQQTGAAQAVMLLIAGKLRVALATTHLPLRLVADAIQADQLERIIRILHFDLPKYFPLVQPRIGVCGLNPHAGEQGLLGDEEIRIITPTIQTLASDGIKVLGPFPADSLFTADKLNDFDVILAMYHDQGLPVLKYAGFGEAVNVTLGLPLIRTSVDHGTALDLVGTGGAKTGSLSAAIAMARAMASQCQDTKQ